ncbi:MAG: L,D-transpeptidase family protein [Myxococcales bacterium]|nr:L,D-transpeptidase family protein [Myxococcales bacterium]
MFRYKTLLPLITIAFLLGGCKAPTSSPNETPSTETKAPTQNKPGSDPKSQTGGDRRETPLVVSPLDPDRKLKLAIGDYFSWYGEQARGFINRHRLMVAAAINKSNRFRGALRVVYKQSNYGFHFFDAKGATERATILQQFVADLPSHALDNELYFTKTLIPELAAEKRLAAEYQALKDQPFSNPKSAALWAILRNPKRPTGDALKPLFTKANLTESDAALVAELKKRTLQLFALREKLNRAQIGLDIKLMRNFFVYSLSFKNVWLYEILKENKLNHKYQKLATAALMASWAEVTKAKSFADGLRRMWPQDPQYERLRKALATYRALSKGPQPKKLKIGRKTIYKKGQSHELIREVKARLALEGFYKGPKPYTRKFDTALVEAVTTYQASHAQLEDGKISKYILRSLNIPFEHRAKVIAINLERWRKSRVVSSDPRFFRVNLAAQRVHLYKDGKVIETHRVIVGSNRKDTDATGKTDHINRTAMFSRPMTMVVLNPYWRVPPRIKKLELDKELEREPDYYEKNKFTITTKPDGTEVVYQNPGPLNALGQVKFLFPNPHMIYMHDTPKRHLFKLPYRAFSHGCIRVDKPVDLARTLFKLDNLLTEEQLKKILKSEKETVIKLKTKIPVHIEYYTASVADDGTVEFHNDIYYYDRDWFREQRKKARLRTQNGVQLSNKP